MILCVLQIITSISIFPSEYFYRIPKLSQHKNYFMSKVDDSAFKKIVVILLLELHKIVVRHKNVRFLIY